MTKNRLSYLFISSILSFSTIISHRRHTTILGESLSSSQSQLSLLSYDDQRNILLSLYEHTTTIYSQWKNSSNWPVETSSSSSDNDNYDNNNDTFLPGDNNGYEEVIVSAAHICEWYGISCQSSLLDDDEWDEDEDEWTMMVYDDMYYQSMNGSYVKLTLTKINLTDNNLVGTIPSTIWELPYLESLLLSDNSIESLNGTFFSTTTTAGITTSLESSSSSLTTLDLSHNHLTNVSTLLSTISSVAPRLQYLHLSSNRFGGTLPPLMISPSLHLLDLSYQSYLSPGPIPNILPMINDTTSSSSSSSSSSSPLSSEITTTTTATAAELLQLTSLSLQYNKLTGDLPPDILHHFPTQTSRITLDLSYNRLSNLPPFITSSSSSQSSTTSVPQLNIYLTGNPLFSLPVTYCDNNEWMDGNVTHYSCRAILCPPGKFNPYGRQISNDNDMERCRTCHDKSRGMSYWGNTECRHPGDRDSSDGSNNRNDDDRKPRNRGQKDLNEEETIRILSSAQFWGALLLILIFISSLLTCFCDKSDFRKSRYV